ncbi:unnamed protein product [Blepharisma stoltei]|uniref:GRF-type domain-containing protein n=1 Tax=Blepharisma stoltei TaxID=1481888 RepID=A0AAU9JWA5_9CILI|nr:unnamed protein product [Blepharisma stoltei]
MGKKLKITRVTSNPQRAIVRSTVREDVEESQNSKPKEFNRIKYRQTTLDGKFVKEKPSKPKTKKSYEIDLSENEQIIIELETDSKKKCCKCNEPAVMRTIRHGQNSGRRFWGCKNYGDKNFCGFFEFEEEFLE